MAERIKAKSRLRREKIQEKQTVANYQAEVPKRVKFDKNSGSVINSIVSEELERRETQASTKPEVSAKSVKT